MTSFAGGEGRAKQIFWETWWSGSAMAVSHGPISFGIAALRERHYMRWPRIPMYPRKQQGVLGPGISTATKRRKPMLNHDQILCLRAPRHRHIVDMLVDDYRNNINCFGLCAVNDLQVRKTTVKGIFFLLFVMVAMTFGASAFELSTRSAYACTTIGHCE
jgi:hypothetical protein